MYVILNYCAINQVTDFSELSNKENTISTLHRDKSGRTEAVTNISIIFAI